MGASPRRTVVQALALRAAHEGIDNHPVPRWWFSTAQSLTWCIYVDINSYRQDGTAEIAAAIQESDLIAVLPRITTFGWVPEFARGFVRDLWPRWVFEKVAQPCEVDLLAMPRRRSHGADGEIND